MCGSDRRALEWHRSSIRVQYNQSLSDKIKAGKAPQDSTWRDDSAEVARRVWQWWRIQRVCFPNLGSIVCLIVLVQVSIAPVERLFSQLKLILEEIQCHSKEDLIFARLYERVNNLVFKRNKPFVPKLDSRWKGQFQVDQDIEDEQMNDRDF